MFTSMTVCQECLRNWDYCERKTAFVWKTRKKSMKVDKRLRWKRLGREGDTERPWEPREVVSKNKEVWGKRLTWSSSGSMTTWRTVIRLDVKKKIESYKQRSFNSRLFILRSNCAQHDTWFLTRKRNETRKTIASHKEYKKDEVNNHQKGIHLKVISRNIWRKAKDIKREEVRLTHTDNEKSKGRKSIDIG